MVDTTKPLNVQIDQIATDLNNKADRDMVNSTVPYVVSRTGGESSFCEVWSDGYCVQKGYYTGGDPTTITLKQAYKDTTYGILISGCMNNHSKTTSSFTIDSNYGFTTKTNGHWETWGYIR